MKRILLTALTLGILSAVPAFVPSANAQRLDQARERAIRECMALEWRDSHDYTRGAGVGHHYRACMSGRGQPE